MRPTVREEILDAAARLFYQEGIRAVGIERILESAGVAKATLYRHFPSKDLLVRAYLEQRHQNVVSAFEDIIRESSHPREQLAAIFDNLHSKAVSSGYRGCAFALALAEHRGIDEVVQIARQHKGWVRDLVETLVPRAGIDDPTVCDHIFLLYEGALATVAVEGKAETMLVAKACALRIFDCAMAFRKV